MAVRTPFNRRRSSSKAAPRDRGDTRTSDDAGVAPRLPHEHDESSDSQTSPPRDEIVQASEDLKQGLVDTDRGPVADRTYRKLKDSSGPR
jgi:hypothetical protein